MKLLFLIFFFVPNFFLVGRELRPHFEILKEVLAAGLVDAQSLKVRTASLMATANFLQVLDEPAERLYFQQVRRKIKRKIKRKRKR